MKWIIKIYQFSTTTTRDESGIIRSVRELSEITITIYHWQRNTCVSLQTKM